MPNNKSVLITGASRGIGKAIAYEFAKNGYDLYLTCKNNIELLKELKLELEHLPNHSATIPHETEIHENHSTTIPHETEIHENYSTTIPHKTEIHENHPATIPHETEIHENHPATIPHEAEIQQGSPEISIPSKCHIFQCDMGNETEVEQLFQAIPQLDVIVNNAGISYVGLLTNMSTEDWRNVMSTNLDSLFYTSKFGVPKMLANHSGKIINISSVWGNVGASMEVAYSASKGAVNSFTKALAKELAPSNIQVNAIACGMIDTDMNACFSEEDLHYIIEEIPADRIGKPEEVARLCYMLAQAPEYMTGQIITMDGGWT